MQFVAIDVEIANSDMGSICQIGLARFIDGRITEEWVTVASRTIIWPLMEQMRMLVIPVFHSLHGRPALEC